MGEREPSDVLQDFLNYIDRCKTRYQLAYDAAGQEDKRLQDLLHELEFSKDRNEERRVSTKLKNSRKKRRNCKDEAMRFELIVSFFDEPAHKGTLNKMRQVLGRQRKQEKFLESEREYKPRVLSE